MGEVCLLRGLLLFPKVACFLDCFLRSHGDATHIPPLKGTQLYFFELSLTYSTFALSKECGQVKSKVNICSPIDQTGQLNLNTGFQHCFDVHFGQRRVHRLITLKYEYIKKYSLSFSHNVFTIYGYS